ncbi:MAG: VWA domain-containing protein, partial [Hyphomicrobiaceae bacterium]|nr:VWA domain-containing protein [Hyphomicrobiaceae bacterium]
MSAAVVDRNVSIPQAAGVIAFNADWNSKQRSTSSNIKITEPNTNEVAAKATANLPTTFLSLLSITSVPIDVNATVAIGHNKAEVAHALDVTGSMSGTKITDLKTAAKLLIDTAYTPAGSDQKVKFSLVPVSSYVKVGLTYRNASWMSVPADSSSTTNIYSTVPPVATISNCTTKTATAYN